MGELIPIPSSPKRNHFSINYHKNQIPWQLELKSLDEKWKYILANQLFTDVSLIVGQTEEILECHRLLLILHSPVFESMLSSRWSRTSSSSNLSSKSSSNNANPSIIHEELYLPDDDPKILKLFLDCIYTTGNSNGGSSGGKVLSQINVDDTLSLLLLAKKYICPHVISACNSHLKLSTSETNVVQIYQTALFVEESDLESYTESYILTKACNLARIGEFNKFTSSELMYFVKRDDLNIDEVELFNAVYNWGQIHAAESEAEQEIVDETTVNNNNNTAAIEKRRRSSIAEVLENILPLIRFPCMSLEDFSVQVVSKSILPLPETVQVYKYLSTPADSATAASKDNANSSSTSTSATDSADELKYSTQPRSRKVFTYIFKRLKGHGFDFGKRWQNLVFQTDQNIRLMSLGFFRSVKPNVQLSIGIKIYNYEMDQLYYEFEDESVNCSADEDIFHLKLPKPFEAVKNVDYTISYIIRGESTFYKSSEPMSIQLACCTDKKITFWIKESMTDTDLDQLPEICFQLYG